MRTRCFLFKSTPALLGELLINHYCAARIYCSTLADVIDTLIDQFLTQTVDVEKRAVYNPLSRS